MIAEQAGLEEAARDYYLLVEEETVESATATIALARKRLQNLGSSQQQ